MGGRGWPPVPWWHNSGMAGLAAAGRAGSAAAVPGLIWAVEVVMTIVEGILLAVSVAVFLYLAVAMFKPERF